MQQSHKEGCYHDYGDGAAFAIVIRKELLIPILCGIFFMESLSVIIQVSYFKRTKKKYGEGKRFYKMAPIHHHYQIKGLPEPKIVIRFWIIGILLAVITIVTLKISLQSLQKRFILFHSYQSSVFVIFVKKKFQALDKI